MRSTRALSACLLAFALTAASDAEEPATVKNVFLKTAQGLSFASDGWSLASATDRGWISLQIGGGEFFDSNPQRGAFVFKKGEHWNTYFPDCGNTSHDDQVGRRGSVSDGINLVSLNPDWQRPEFEIYLGANEKEDQRVFIFLHPDVTLIRMGASQNRPWIQTVLRAGGDGLRKTREALIVHRNGCALAIRATTRAKGPKGEDLPPQEFEVGTAQDPAGAKRLAIVLPCKGFAANSYQAAVDAVSRMENFVTHPKFDVKSSDDPADNKQLGATHGVGNPIYSPTTKLDFGLTFGWLKDEPFSGHAELEITHSLGEKHFSQRVDVKGTGEIRVQFDPKFRLPGVSEVWARLVGADNRLIWVGRYRMAYDWEHYRPALRVEPDFKEFWDKTLAELRATPLEPETVRVREFEDHPSFEIYDVTFSGWNKQRLHAMLFVPKNVTRPAPVIVTAHPGTTGFGVNKRPDGVYGSELRQDPRFVTIVPLIRGHAPDAKDIPFNHPWWGPLEDRDTYVARAWYCAMVRAIDYLATRPELVDIKRIVARGGSQGGALALVTAALDDRVAVCLSDCPACCQPQEIMNNYSSFGPAKGAVPKGKTVAEVERLLSYYNPVNFCPLIKCPAYVGSNIGDLTVHSMGPLAAYHNLTALPAEQKAFYPGFTHFHGSGPGLGVKTGEWLEKLGGKLPEKK